MLKLQIIDEDEHYIFVNKPSGILTIPDRHDFQQTSVVTELRKKHERIFIIHRLDRDTSGCICFAKTEQAHRYTSQLFEQRQVEKWYVGIVNGQIIPDKGLIDASIMEHPTLKGKMLIHQKQGKPSQTEYEVLESFGKYSFVKFKLLTGRTHQIRVHMKNIGHSLVCDEMYGEMNPIYISNLKKNYKQSKLAENESPILNRLALHAFQLKFVGESGHPYFIEASLPKDLDATLKQCRKWL
jgi:23S rRNA pseudouridine955/2504/2580 synthase/23S rRNA pseudouridine1911/1915/1917 synthase